MRSKPNFLDWLGINQDPDFGKARPLGALIGFGVVISFVVSIAVALLCLGFLFGALLGSGPFGAAVRNLGLLLAGAFGASFLVWRAIVAQKQADVADQAQITERIAK